MHDAKIGAVVLVLFVVLAVVVLALVVTLSQTRPIINCSILSNPAQFVVEHPEYLKRLDRDNDGVPCEKKAPTTNPLIIWQTL